jgi:hypothetical protein
VQGFAQGWRGERLRPLAEMRFVYEEEAAAEEFFVPYIWSLAVGATNGGLLHWWVLLSWGAARGPGRGRGRAGPAARPLRRARPPTPGPNRPPLTRPTATTPPTPRRDLNAMALLTPLTGVAAVEDDLSHQISLASVWSDDGGGGGSHHSGPLSGQHAGA